jgi:hypothetical protein
LPYDHILFLEMATKFHKQKLTLGEQLAHIHHYFPDFRTRIHKGTLIATGTLTPSAVSRTYMMRVSYKLGKSPKVNVISPDLSALADSKPLPHIYGGNEICLFLPGSGEWTSSMFLAETVVPWTVEWLFFFEIWNATGEWYGGGKHPEPKNQNLPHQSPKHFKERIKACDI